MLIYKTILLFSIVGALFINQCDGSETTKPKTDPKLIKQKIAEKTEAEVTKFMKFLKVIPDVINEGPGHFLRVTYDSGVFADKGVELTPTQVKNEPTITWKPEPNAFYALIMTDPDAPSRAEPSKREWHHWLVGNIPGNEINKGDVLSAYVGAGPPEGTGLHRYVFLLFKQPGKLSFDEERLPNNSDKGRANFSTQKFAEKYKLGVPLAGNFFQAQYDAYVPELYKQLGA